jgi:hypothetical protein
MLRSQSSLSSKSSGTDAFEWASIFGAGLILLVFVSLALIAAGGWDWFSNFLTTSASSWVQAVGSIAAIWGAFAIANQQKVAQNAKDEETERQKRRLRFEVCHNVLQRVNSAFDSGEKAGSNLRSLSVLHIEINHATGLLDSLPLFEVPDALLVHRINLVSQSLRHSIALLNEVEPFDNESLVQIFVENARDAKRECSITVLYCRLLIKATGKHGQVEEWAREQATLKELAAIVDKLESK